MKECTLQFKFHRNGFTKENIMNSSAIINQTNGNASYGILWDGKTGYKNTSKDNILSDIVCILAFAKSLISFHFNS